MSRFLATVIQQFRNNVPEERGIERGFAFFPPYWASRCTVRAAPKKRWGLLWDHGSVYGNTGYSVGIMHLEDFAWVKPHSLMIITPGNFCSSIFLRGWRHSLFNKYLSNFDYLKKVFIKDHFGFWARIELWGKGSGRLGGHCWWILIESEFESGCWQYNIIETSLCH